MRVAVVHDWLVTYAGAERVLEQMLAVFPNADLFSLVDYLPETERHFLGNRSVEKSFVQSMPGAKKRYRSYLPLMMLAVEQFDLSAYDLVISSSHAVAKGVITGPEQLHICMCYSPMRYAWDLQHQYLREARLDKGLRGWMARWLLHKARLWDVRTANGVDRFIAISDYVAKRIQKAYRRESTVIYPPVDVARFALCREKEDLYVTASRMVPYKRIDLIVESFSAMPERRLVVIGDGPEMAKIKAKAGANVALLGYQEPDVLRDYLQRARAFVFAAEEDFGIAPLEAQACGTPVIAYGRGGARETIIALSNGDWRGRGTEAHGPTGVFFEQQTVESVCEAVKLLEANQALIGADACRENAMRFSPERFRSEFLQFVETAVANYGDKRAIGFAKGGAACGSC